MSKPTIIITGASRGLGAAAARIAAEWGANLVLNARSGDEVAGVARRICDESGEAGGEAIAVPGDVSNWEECQQLVERAVERFGSVDALINNAGVIGPFATIAEVDIEAWRYNLSVNLVGPMMLIQAALPHLRKSGGRVVNVSSGAAISPVAGWSAYCASKAALNHLTRVLALEEPAITAIALRPGIVDTEMQAQIRSDGDKGMSTSDHQRFLDYHEQGELQPPEMPGRALAALALRAPHEWSGEFLAWDEERVQQLVGVGA